VKLNGTEARSFSRCKDAKVAQITEEYIMGLRINTNVSAMNATRILRKNTLSLNKTLERLSSGLRINRAADDAAGLAIAETFRSLVTGSAVAQRNSQDGVSMIQTTEGALVETSNILQRIRELALQSANGTNSLQNRAALDAEVQQLLQHVDDIAFDTEFNGLRTLSAPQTITLQSGPQQLQQITITTNGASGAVLGLTNLSISDMNMAIGAISVVDVALQSVNMLRADLGAIQNRLEYTISTLAVQEENNAFSESMIRDADVAVETMRFTRNQILVSAGTTVLAQANVIPQSALQLLGG
jgi:flagellin